jgi:hypothetical protein
LPTRSIAIMGASSASNSRVSTFISLPWLTSPDTLQLRTTSGTTSGNEVVPRHRGAPAPLYASRASRRAYTPAAVFVRAWRLRRRARGRSMIRAALFAARCRCRCRSRGRKPWRERPRCARPRWPRARPEGSLTPSLSLSQSVSAMVSRAARSALCSRVDYARMRPRFPGRTGSVFPGNVGLQTRRFHVRFATQMFTGNRPGNRVSCNVNLASFAVAARLIRRPSRRQCCICARHRARRCASLRPRMRAAFGP